MIESTLLIVSLGFSAFVEYLALENNLELVQEESDFFYSYFVFSNDVDFCIMIDFYIKKIILPTFISQFTFLNLLFEYLDSNSTI